MVTTSLSGTNGGTINGGASSPVSVGNFVPIIIPNALRLSFTPGVGTTIGSNTARIDFNIDAVTVSAFVPFNYSVSNALTVVTPGFAIVNSGINSFRVDIGSWGGALPANSNNAIGLDGRITFLSASAPEPGTFVLLGLGIAPIAVAIRRRRK